MSVILNCFSSSVLKIRLKSNSYSFNKFVNRRFDIMFEMYLTSFTSSILSFKSICIVLIWVSLTSWSVIVSALSLSNSLISVKTFMNEIIWNEMQKSKYQFEFFLLVLRIFSFIIRSALSWLNEITALFLASFCCL